MALEQFSAPDLSAIARGLDELEQSYDEGHRGRSTNMDDTGVYPTTQLDL
jgi:ataxin-3